MTTTNVPETKSPRVPHWVWAAAGVLAVAVVIAIAIVATSGSPAPSAASAPIPTSTPGSDSAAEGARPGEMDIVRRNADDPQAIGRVDAPVVLIWWADLRCPFCAAFAQQTLPTLIKKYVDTGKVRIEVHEVGYFGDQSVDAAVAARAAGNQGKFFEFLEAVYAAAPLQGHPDMPESKLIAFAKQVGVPDMKQFRSDFHSADLRAAVLQTTAEAHRLGITGVPFFVAGQQPLSGALPTSAFITFLDAALAKV